MYCIRQCRMYIHGLNNTLVHKICDLIDTVSYIIRAVMNGSMGYII